MASIRFVLVLITAGWCGFANGHDGDSAVLRRPSVGLVLSGGGAKGMAHVGVLKVLEEVKMPIDYIGGTSMGSIVGGLYSLGYSAGQLETYMLEKNWNALLTDNIARRNTMYDEKGEHKRYWLRFPFFERKLKLPSGVLTGQNVSNLFTELASPGYMQDDFTKLPTPFLCVGTDLKNGSEVLIEHGQLPKAMRASMAIPSVFTPEVIDGRPLFDGGLVNNFPADHVHDHGLDILIGVDVTNHSDNVEPSSIYQIMEQVIFLTSIPRKEANKKFCRLVIVPKIGEYKSSSFNAADSLIRRGERAARAQYAELKALADSLNRLDPPTSVAPRHAEPLSYFRIGKVFFTGLTTVSEQYALRKMGIKLHSKMTFARLNNAVEMLKGTLLFKSIVYNIQPSLDEEGYVDIYFDMVEQSNNLFRVGLHYDKEYEASLMLNLTFTNMLLNNSRTQVGLALGRYPMLTFKYFQRPGAHLFGTGLFPSLLPEWFIQVDAFRRGYGEYNGRHQIGEFKCLDILPTLNVQVAPTINSVVGMGIGMDYASIRSRFDFERYDTTASVFFATYKLYYYRDSYNEDYFPTAGHELKFDIGYHRGLSKNVRSTDLLIDFKLHTNFATAMSHRWTIQSGVDAAAIIHTNAVPEIYLIHAGGLPDRIYRSEFRFVGVNFMQKSANNLISVHFDNQIRMWKNIYLTLRTQLGKMENEYSDLFKLKDLMFGYGASLNYNTIVGPVGVTISSSNVTRSMLTALHLGYWF